MNEEEMYDGTLAQTNTEQDTDKKCPSCSGTMEYDPATGGLMCPYCGHTESIEVKNGTKNEVAVDEQDFFAAVETESFDWGAEKKTVTCKACGAVLVYDALQNSEICAYCGSNQVMENNDEKTMKPGGVVPFKITEKQASEKFQEWIKGKWFCPNEAKRTAKAGKFKGIYLPYWTYDTNTVSEYVGQYGTERRVTRRVNGKTVTETVIDWHNTSGVHKSFINDYPVLASKNHDTRMLEGILPFDTEDNKAYEPKFVAGFVSERYAIGLKEGWEIAKPGIQEQLRSEVDAKICDEHHTSHARNIRLTTRYNDLKYKYLLLPVWNSSFKYRDKVFNFMVNGQTGKVSGKSPISPIKVAIAVILGLIAAFILYKLIAS